MIIIRHIRLTCSCEALLPQNPCGHACSYSKCDFCFAWFITAKCPLCISMSAVTLKRMAGFKLAATMFARSTCFRLTRLTAHRQPQQVQCWQFVWHGSLRLLWISWQFEASLNVYCEQRLKCESQGNGRFRSKSMSKRQTRWF